MATNFPASLDTLTNPTSSDSLSSPSHSAQHANVNDAVEALQAKVGADSSAVTSSLDYKVAQLEARTEGALVFISRTTIGSAVSSVTVSGAFSSDYDNYRIIIAGSQGSTTSAMEMTLGSKTTGYYGQRRITNFVSGADDNYSKTNASEWEIGAFNSANNGTICVVDLAYPYSASITASFFSYGSGAGYVNRAAGDESSSAGSHTSFTIAPNNGTMTGGTIDVYGYVKA